MSSRMTTMCGAIGLAVALSFGAAASSGAQVTSDTSTTRSDTSAQRIPVQKETGTSTLDTSAAGGAIAPTDTTTTSDTTGVSGNAAVGADTGTTTDTSSMRSDTSRMGTDTTTTNPTDTTGGVTGAGAATDSATSRSNMSTDSTVNPARNDTTTNPTGVSTDTTTNPTGVTTDTTANPTGVTTDTTTNPAGVSTDTTTNPAGVSADTTTQVQPDTMSAQTGVSANPSSDTTYTAPGTSRGRFFHNGFYIGVGGGASVPVGDFKDGYKTGWNVTVPIGWQSATTPWGVRVDATYDRVTGKSLSAGASSFELTDTKIWSGNLDLTFRIPLGTSGRSGVYLLGGGGVNHFTDYGGSSLSTGDVTFTTNTRDVTKANVNGGAGFEFPLGAVNMFVEGRFISVFTENKNTNYIPVIAGFKFF